MNGPPSVLRRLLLASLLGAGTACSGVDDGSTSGATGASADAPIEGGGSEGRATGQPRRCPTGGDPQPHIAFDRNLAASSTSTTPTELAICLNQDVDRVLLLSQVHLQGEPVTSCSAREVIRIGRNPMRWEIGTLRTFELSYPEVLPPGTYDEVTTAIVSAPGYYLVTERTARFFEVDAEGMRSISPEQYERASRDDTPPLANSEPCPEWHTFGDVPNDELPASETVSVIDLDDWSRVATLQPVRHEVRPFQNPLTGRSTLSFEAWSAQRQHLVLQLAYLPEAGVDFETDEFSLQLQQPDRGDWYSRSGHITVRDRGGEQLEVRLSGVVLDKGRTVDEPELTRTLPDGSIVGSVKRLCRTLSELDDATWSSPFCGQIRQTAGF